MLSFDELYVSSTDYSIHMLRRRGKIPGFSVGRPANILPVKKVDETIAAMMVIVEKDPTRQDIESRRVVPLQEILNDMPITLRGGTISWLILEGEEEPSSLIIHKAITAEELAMFAQTRLTKKAIEKTLKGHPSDHNKIMEAHSKIEEAKEQAKRSKLGNSEPVDNYIR